MYSRSLDCNAAWRYRAGLSLHSSQTLAKSGVLAFLYSDKSVML